MIDLLGGLIILLFFYSFYFQLSWAVLHLESVHLQTAASLLTVSCESVWHQHPSKTVVFLLRSTFGSGQKQPGLCPLWHHKGPSKWGNQRKKRIDASAFHLLGRQWSHVLFNIYIIKINLVIKINTTMRIHWESHSHLHHLDIGDLVKQNSFWSVKK